METDLFGNPLPPIKLTPKGTVIKTKINPCLAVFGKGPEGAICKTCTHLYAKNWDKVYYKCNLRKNTNGPGTDHRVRWSACGKYEPNNESK